MNLDTGAVQGDNFELDPDYPLSLQLFEDSVEHSALGPSAHPGVDGVPVAEVFGQSAPLAAVFCDVEDGVEHLYVGDADIAALHREMRLYELVLSSC